MEILIVLFFYFYIVCIFVVFSLEWFLFERMIIMEFVGLGILWNILDNEKEIIEEECRIKFVFYLMMVLEFIYVWDIVYLDVKLVNILVDFRDICKLGDFGCS